MKIASFQVDHTKMDIGVYLSRKDEVKNNAITYDIRFHKPNSGKTLTESEMHTLEHLGATYFRLHCRNLNTIYFGGMGCMTGFYLVLDEKEPMTPFQLSALVMSWLEWVMAYEGKVPGQSEKECGNYKTLDLSAAKWAAKRYYFRLKDVHNENLNKYAKEKKKKGFISKFFK